MNPLKKLAGQTAIYGLPTIVGRLLNYLLVPLITYKFTNPGDFGINTEFYSYISFVNIIVLYGMETALFNFSVQEKNKNSVYSTALISLIISTLIFTIAVLSLSQPISALLRYPDHSEYIVWVTLIIALDALTAIPFAKLREQNKARRFAIVKSINIAVNIGLTVFFIGFCKTMYDRQDPVFFDFVKRIYNPDVGIGYVFIANLIANAVSFVLLLPEMFMVKPAFDLKLWKRMIVYSSPLILVGLAGMINETIDRLLLKYLLPEEISMEQVGIYGACYKISIIITIFIQAFKFAAEPFFFSHSKEGDAKTLYARIMNYFIIICTFIFLGTTLNLSWIQYFVGKEYRQGLHVVPILLFANLCLGIYYNLSIWYKLTGKTRLGAYITIVGAIITLSLNFYWIPRIGYLGSAWATLICYVSMMVLSYLIGRKYYPVNYDLKRILGYLTLSLTLYFISTWLKINNDTLHLLVNNLLLLIFAAAVYRFEKPAMAIKNRK